MSEKRTPSHQRPSGPIRATPLAGPSLLGGSKPWTTRRMEGNHMVTSVLGCAVLPGIISRRSKDAGRPRGAPTCAARSAHRIHHSAPPEEPRALLVRRADAGTANECGSPGPGRGKRPNACAPRLRRRSRPIPTRSCGAARSGCQSTVGNRSDLERSSSRSGASARKR